MKVGRSWLINSRTAALAAVLLFTACKDKPAPAPSEPPLPTVPRGLAVLEHQIPIPDARPGRDTWDLEFTVDSLFYLLHGNEPIIRVFTHDGKPVRTITTSAAAPTLMGWKGDSLWVYDSANRRVSLFAADGKAGRSWKPFPESKAVNAFRFAAMLSDGSVLAYADSAPQTNSDVFMRSALVRVKNSTPVQIDTFARFEPGTSARVAVSARDSLIWLITETVPQPDRGIIGVIKLKPNGETVFAKEFAYNPIPSGRMLLRSVTDMFEAANGSVLMRREDVGTDLILWTVLSRFGTRIAELETPRGAGILVADGTFVYGITPDDQNRPAITRYKIERPDTIRKQ